MTRTTEMIAIATIDTGKTGEEMERKKDFQKMLLYTIFCRDRYRDGERYRYEDPYWDGGYRGRSRDR